MKIACRKAYSFILYTAVQIILILFPLFISSALADAPWPMSGHDARHSMQSQYAGAQGNNIKWQYNNDDNDGFSSIVIDSNKTIYASHRDKIAAINSDGTLEWTFSTNDWGCLIIGLAVGHDGTIYFTSKNEYLYAINPDGTLKWKYYYYTGSIDVSSPIIGPSGTIYIRPFFDSFKAI
jgi:hypothetical protein